MGVDFKKLQNGSDIRGVALEGVKGEAVNLNRDAGWRLMKGFADYLARTTGKKKENLVVSVGHDSRLSAESLKEAVIDSLAGDHIQVLDCGLASTPAMFMTTIFDEYRCDGAVMITASHLPWNRNGFKFFDRDGGLDKEDIQDVIRFAEEEAPKEEDAGSDDAASKEGTPGGKKAEPKALLRDYAGYLRKKIVAEVKHPQSPDRPLTGLKIAVDAGNGAGGFFATEILAPLGADVSASQFLNPDGRFPNHAPNPENKEAMASVCKAVKENGCDLGLIFDTDVDRSAAVDQNGKEISRNAIVALAAALIAREHPGTTVVTDSITSDQLTVYLEQCLGLRHLRYKRGYKNVINMAKKLNEEGTDCQLAIETSGHAAYKENYFLDDGAYLATKIVIKAARLKRKGESLSLLLTSLEEPKEAVEYRFPVLAEDFQSLGSKILRDLESLIASGKTIETKKGMVELRPVIPNYEGVRIDFSRERDGDDEGLAGWCLLRKSLHDPILPLNIEVTRGNCQEILEILKNFLGRYEGVEVF